MISLIASDLRAKTSFSSMTEVDLFRQLSSSIMSYTPSTFVDETHGVKCKVAFNSVTGSPERCEISDLLILSVGFDESLRATFWQAKKEPNSDWNAVSEADKQFDFKGQFNQWDLLARRPSILNGYANFMPPTDILSSFESASIGSMGVFYESNGLIQVYHSTAEAVVSPQYTANGTGKVKLCINGYLCRYRYGGQEIIVRATLEEFLASLLSHEIGALLSPQASAHRWLAQYARIRASTSPQATSDGSASAIAAIDEFLGSDLPIPDISTPSDGGLSILIVRQMMPTLFQ